MSASALKRPSKLYRYATRADLERALQFGEFRLEPPAAQNAPNAIMPFGPRAAPGFLTLSLASAWDESLFDASGADCCLVINDAEQFGERIHRAAQRLLPSWAGIDAAVSYGRPSPLGEVFSRPRDHATEKEWLFAWRPTQPTLVNKPVTITIGSIEGIAELRTRP
ncbi:hypothetical protein AYR66_16230 [Noviherbaspirillum denitrificans]|uniref:Uncharacterized protein n=2 Tax=Noviherbaspirillum denitrificans TaxID=1968433 RepID=A0A254TM56_9BURK|nr:hypothetical protein [Noviherbaspirillum denitrificans]OWW20788.1 hypothetical protein AYR66_16230 [Noviherbaspirillum denitrificans]